MVETTSLAPDGSTFTVDAGSTILTRGWSYVAWLVGPRGRTRLNTGQTGANENLLERERDGTTIVVSDSFQGDRRLLTVEYVDHGQTLFIWQGEHHEVYTSLAGLGVPLESFIGLLQPLRIEDRPNGVRLMPRVGTGFALTGITGVNVVDGVAGIQVFPTEAVVHTLPQSRGRTVRGGEVWRTGGPPGSDGPSGSLVIANDTAVAHVTPVTDASASAVTSLVEELSVTRAPR